VILWRVSNYSTLDGIGGLRAPGRWHSRGRRVVYAAQSPASALLEVMAHAGIDLDDLPVKFRYLEIDAPDSIAVETIEPGSLASGWRADQLATRRIGDEWLVSGRTALLRVPSAIVPATWNFVIHSQHPESGSIRIVKVHEQAFDRRLRRS
jgi:RES domain-containing protein